MLTVRCPAGHCVHVVLPVPLAISPVGHCVHVPPVPAKPAGQASHIILSLALGCCPAGQASQVDWLLMVRSPAAHGVHEVLPVPEAEAISPTGHDWHWVLPGFAVNCPARHGMHRILPSAYCPAGHGSQALMFELGTLTPVQAAHAPPAPMRACPLGQSTHWVLSPLALSVPVHGVQVVVPGLGATDSPAHVWHSNGSSLNSPAGHARHSFPLLFGPMPSPH